MGHTPIGRTIAFGGDVLIRVEVMKALGGYDESLIAGEDPDLAARSCAAGWPIERLSAEMTIHDAELNRFGQWWTRQVRAGHAAVEAWPRSRSSDRGPQRRLASIVFWGGILPIFALAMAPPGFFLFAAYPVLAIRIYRQMRRRGRSRGGSAIYAASCIEGKFAELFGALQCFARRVARTQPRLVEYK